MMNLSKFYDLLHKSATVELIDGPTGRVFYRGTVKNIPDEFDAYKVYDFRMTNEGVILFDIEKCEEATP